MPRPLRLSTTLLLLGGAGLTALLGRGCGRARHDAEPDGGAGGTAATSTGARAGTAPAGGAGAVGGAIGAVDVVTTSGGAAGAGCYRDPYLPDDYELPCDQPEAVPDCAAGWCTISPGCFFMGSPWCEWGRARDTDNPIQVTLTHRFRIQQFELTQAEWVALGVPNPSDQMDTGKGDCLEEDCPVGNVTWYEALAFANLRSRAEGLPECYVLEGCTGELGEGMVCATLHATPAVMYDCEGYRLPTGAEWEYAARAGTRTSVYTGEVIDHAGLYECFDDPILSPIAWYCANAADTTHPVGLKEPNGWGLHDVIGNATEWVASIYGMYVGGPHVDYGAELALGDGTQPISSVELRGGNFVCWPNLLAVGKKAPETPERRATGHGFRLAQTLPGPAGGP